MTIRRWEDGLVAEMVQEGDRYRCPVEGCGCEIQVSSTPQMAANQIFVDCCGHEMEKVS